MIRIICVYISTCDELPSQTHSSQSFSLSFSILQSLSQKHITNQRIKESKDENKEKRGNREPRIQEGVMDS